MFKKIELWVVLLLCVIFFISAILYGALLRHHYYMADDRFLRLKKIAVFFAEIPYSVKKIVTTKSFNLNSPRRLTKNSKIPRFERFIETKRDVLLILPRYDNNLKRSVVDIIDINTFGVLHTYKHDITAMNDMINASSEEHKRYKIDDAEIRFLYWNPLILEDGSLLSIGSGTIFKTDICSNLLWVNQEEMFHHSINLEDKENIWAGAKMFPYSNFVKNYKKKFGYNDDAIARVNLNGEIVFLKSISELLYEKRIFKESNIFSANHLSDPIHLNDIEPTFNTTQYWEKGDLFISILRQPAIIHYRPSTNEIINYIEGPFYAQHDVDIISDKEISIFNNNDSVLENSKYSEILIYNFETKTFTKKFNEQLQKENFKTSSEGLSEILKDGSMLVDEHDHGRLIFFNNKGEKEWEFVNKDDNGYIYFTSWPRIIEDKVLIDKIRKKIKDTKCLN